MPLKGKLLFTAFIFYWGMVWGQHGFDTRIDTVHVEQPLTDVLSRLEERTSLKFFYLEKWLEPYKVTPELSGSSLRDLLFALFDQSDIDYSILFDYAVIFRKDPSGDIKRQDFLQSASNRSITPRKVTIGSDAEFVPGAMVTISGRVTAEGKTFPGGTVYINDTETAVSTDENGNYRLTVSSGPHVVSYRGLGYKEELIDLEIYKDGEVNIDLQEVPTTLQEVIIQDQPITSSRLGFSTIRFSDVKRAPAFLGEADVIKQIQMQSGVTTTSEASSGFSVRGGGADQNLILYDGVPIFNSTHALGFLTSFNADAVSEAAFYKGAVPAEYGGRVSSVLNMASREGSFEKWNGNVGVGFITSHLTLGGPIKKDTSSVIVSFRSSYSDWILDLVKTKFNTISDGSVFFWDGSAKFSQRLPSGNRLTFSTYTTLDKFQLANDTVNGWRTLAISARFDKTISPTLFYSVGASFGNYTYTVSQDDPTNAFRLKYGVVYPGLRLDFNKNNALHKLTFGFQSTYYQFSPGDLEPRSTESTARRVTMPKEHSLESAVYFGDAYSWTDNLNVEVGLRLSMYNRFGPGTEFLYEPDQPLDPSTAIDSVSFASGKIMKTYIGPEPRVAIKYELGKSSSIKLGYNRMYQYIHLISNTAVITPVDIWQSSNQYFKPQISDQISLGYFTVLTKPQLEMSAELYYKKLQNLLDFRDGANLILNSKLETALLPGIGRSYGLELTFRKKSGTLTGEFNYTYSRSFRKVDGEYEEDRINDGNYYPSNADIPVNLNINWRYQLARKAFLTGSFVYHTGRPVSITVGGYEVDHIPISDFSNRNNYRISDYHRLDVAIVIEGSNRKRKWGQGYWSLSIYNLYGRRNPYSVFFEDNGGSFLKGYQLSLIGTAVPSVKYGYKF